MPNIISCLLLGDLSDLLSVTYSKRVDRNKKNYYLNINKYSLSQNTYPVTLRALYLYFSKYALSFVQTVYNCQHVMAKSTILRLFGSILFIVLRNTHSI